MGQINLTFTSKKIDPKDHILSVLIETDSFVYGVFDKEYNLVAAGHHAVNMRSEDPLLMIANDPLLNRNYYKTVISYSTLEFAHLSPLDYDGGQFDAYFNNLSVGDEILTDKFTDSEVHVVFPVNKSLRKKLVKLLQPNTEVHVSTAMRQYIYPSMAKKNIVLVESQKLHFMSYAGGDLIMYNAYSYVTKEDFLYYIQLATEFVGVDREVEQIELGGWVGSDSDIYKFVAPYYRKLSWVDLPSMGLLSEDESHLKHHYFGIYAGAICVS